MARSIATSLSGISVIAMNEIVTRLLSGALVGLVIGYLLPRLFEVLLAVIGMG